MTSPPIRFAEASVRLDQPLARVWEIVAGFGGLQHWVDGVSDCTVEGHGVGAIRTLVRNGNRVQERLEAVDPAAHSISYSIMPPHRLPASNVRGTITLDALPDGGTRISWQADATDFVMPPEEFGHRIGKFYADSIEGLRHLLER